MLDLLIHSDSIPATLARFGLPGGGEWIVLLVLGLLIFGRRLPEVGRSLGRGIVEFKRGIRGVEDDVDEEVTRPRSKKSLPEEGNERPSQFSSESREHETVRPDKA